MEVETLLNENTLGRELGVLWMTRNIVGECDHFYRPVKIFRS